MSQPVGQFRLAKLGQVVDTLFAEVDAAEVDILRRRLAHSLNDDGGVGFENDAVVDDLVNSEGNEVVVFNDCALVDGLPREVLVLVELTREKGRGAAQLT